jgi:hypothetical protein
MTMGACTVGGAEGEAISFDGEMFVGIVTRAFAPGTPFTGAITLADGAVAIEGRATGSKRTADGRFEVRARLINMRREDRVRLEAASRGA